MILNKLFDDYTNWGTGIVMFLVMSVMVGLISLIVSFSFDLQPLIVYIILMALFGLGTIGDFDNVSAVFYSLWLLVTLGIILFINDFKINLLTIILVFIATEILFWFDKEKKPKKTSKFKFTIKKKFESFFESLFVVTGINFAIIIFPKLKEWFVKYWPTILKWIGYIGAIIIVLLIVIGVLWLYIKLNSLKYKEK